MTDDEFWAIVPASKKSLDTQSADIRKRLSVLSVADIEAFDRRYRELMLRAYTWDLWGAAYVINGGASDDGFEYFRSWLISRGRTIFESALANPDSLAGFIKPEIAGEAEFEEFIYMAGDVWVEKTGRELDEMPVFVAAGEPTGTPFDEDDTDALIKRYPKLYALFEDE